MIRTSTTKIIYYYVTIFLIYFEISFIFEQLQAQWVLSWLFSFFLMVTSGLTTRDVPSYPGGCYGFLYSLWNVIDIMRERLHKRWSHPHCIGYVYILFILSLANGLALCVSISWFTSWTSIVVWDSMSESYVTSSIIYNLADGVTAHFSQRPVRDWVITRLTTVLHLIPLILSTECENRLSS